MKCGGHRARTGCGGVSMAEGREGHGARKGNGVRGHHLSSPPCFVQNLLMYFDLTCKRGSVGQSEGLSIPRSSVRFRLEPDTSLNSHEFELHRPSKKGTKLLLIVIKAIIIIIGANGLSIETDRWGRARGESRGFRQQPRGT